MNVLIYTHTFAPRIGGVQTYAMLLAQGLMHAASKTAADRTHQVTVVTPTPAEGFDDTKLPFRIARQPNLRTLWRLIGEADILQLAGPVISPLFIGLIQRKPIVIEHHGYQAICPNGMLFYEPTKTACDGHFMARRYRECLKCNAAAGRAKSLYLLMLTFLRRFLCHFATAHTPITHHVLWRLRFPRSQVVYYGIPDPGAHPISFKSHRSDTAPFCFAYVGRLVSEKGLPLLLHAIRRLKDQGYNAQLKLIGDGPEHSYLENMAHNLDIQQQVCFTGFLQNAKLNQALDDVAVMIMPSIWEETAGLAAIEHMMRGRLVIASQIGGLGEIVDGIGLRFKAGDVDELTACLRRVLDDPGVVETLGYNARQHALQLFQQERMADEYLKLYAELI